MTRIMSGPIKVMDIELSSSVTDMHGLGRYASIQALIRLNGRVLGTISVSVPGDSCRATAIMEAINASLRRPLFSKSIGTALSWRSTQKGWVIDRIPAAPSTEEKGPLPLVTVAVSTRDRLQHLGMCLKAISRLTYPRLDLLVIDNAPHSQSAERLVKRGFSGMRYIVEPRPGLDWARNRAIREARGEIIAFIDDDVVVDRGWVQALVRVFVDDPDVMAVTGLVVPYELETEAQILFERYGGFGKGFELKRIPPCKGTRHCRRSHLAAGDLGTGANMAFRRSIFEKIGGFDPCLDMGTETCGGGDLEMFFRVVQEGYTLVYEPDAMVRHIHRSEYNELKTQIRGWGTAFIAYLVRTAMAYPEARSVVLFFMIRWFIGRHLIRILRHLWGPQRIPFDLMMTELAGSLTGLFAYHRACRNLKRIEAQLGHRG